MCSLPPPGIRDHEHRSDRIATSHPLTMHIVLLPSVVGILVATDSSRYLYPNTIRVPHVITFLKSINKEYNKNLSFWVHGRR